MRIFMGSALDNYKKVLVAFSAKAEAKKTIPVVKKIREFYGLNNQVLDSFYTSSAGGFYFKCPGQLLECLIAMALRGVTNVIEYLDFKSVGRARLEGRAAVGMHGVW